MSAWGTMDPMDRRATGIRQPGVAAAQAAAVLFGAGTPVAKLLLDRSVDPWLLAGLLYTGSGLGLAAYRAVTRRPRSRPASGQWPWLVGAIAAGGLAGPVLQMAGLARMPATGASLLLNAEAVLTAVLAWVVFREHTDRRIVAGMVFIVAGAVVLSLPERGGVTLGGGWGPVLVVSACLCWAVDNNLTRKVALTDETWLAMVKGLVAGPVNLALAMARGSPGRLRPR